MGAKRDGSQGKNEQKKEPRGYEHCEGEITHFYPWEAVISRSEADERHFLCGQGAQSHVTPPGATQNAFSGNSTSCHILLLQNTDASSRLTGLVEGSRKARPEMGILGAGSLRRGMREVD